MLNKVKPLLRYKLTRKYDIELFRHSKQHEYRDQEKLTEKDVSL